MFFVHIPIPCIHPTLSAPSSLLYFDTFLVNQNNLLLLKNDGWPQNNDNSKLLVISPKNNSDKTSNNNPCSSFRLYNQSNFKHKIFLAITLCFFFAYLFIFFPHIIYIWNIFRVLKFKVNKVVIVARFLFIFNTWFDMTKEGEGGKRRRKKWLKQYWWTSEYWLLRRVQLKNHHSKRF